VSAVAARLRRGLVSWLLGEPGPCPVDGTPVDQDTGLCVLGCGAGDRALWLETGHQPYGGGMREPQAHST
jgi:hypothetical protein